MSPAGPSGCSRHVVGEAGAEERAIEPVGAARPDGASVQGGTAPAHRREQLVAHRVVHHAGLHAMRPLHGDAHREVRQLVGVVRRPVERVDDPPVAGLGAGAARPALLREDGVVRMAVPEPGEEHRLARLVRVGDQVDAALVGDGPRLVELLGQDPAGAASALDRGLEQRVGRDAHRPSSSSASTFARMSFRFPSKLSCVKRTCPVRSTTQVVGMTRSLSALLQHEATRIDQDGQVRLRGGEEGGDLRPVLVDADRVHAHPAGRVVLLQRLELRQRAEAGSAPGGPGVDDHHLPLIGRRRRACPPRDTCRARCCSPTCRRLPPGR